MVVERWWQVPLSKVGRPPRLQRRHRIYRLLEDTKHLPKGELELILTQSVEGRCLRPHLPLPGHRLQPQIRSLSCFALGESEIPRLGPASPGVRSSGCGTISGRRAP